MCNPYIVSVDKDTVLIFGISKATSANLSHCLNDKAKCRRDAALCFKQVLSQLEYLFYAALFLTEDAAELGHRIERYKKGYCA